MRWSRNRAGIRRAGDGRRTRADSLSVGSELLEVNFAQLVGGMGQGIADAQLRLDMVSMQLAQMMSGQDYKLLKLDENGDFVFDKDNNPVTIDMPAVRISFGGGDCAARTGIHADLLPVCRHHHRGSRCGQHLA